MWYDVDLVYLVHQRDHWMGPFFLRDFTGLPVLDGIHAPSICDAARPI